MRIRDRISRLEDRFPVPLPARLGEGDLSLDPDEHERRFGYRIITLEMTAAKAARQYLGTLRSTAGVVVDDNALRAGMTIAAAGARYRELLG